MRLTGRCIELLKLLRTARWLTTAQIRRRFFRHATLDAVRKRMRKLTGAEYVIQFRRDRMGQALFAVGPRGKQLLEKAGMDTVIMERTPPKQIEHSIAINDLRIAAEVTTDLTYFYASWELPSVGWRHPIIPDGLVCFGTRVFALEFDRGVEGVQFFIRTKMHRYEMCAESFPLAAVIIVTDRSTRMMSLAKAINTRRVPVIFTMLDVIIADGFHAPIFFSLPAGWDASLLENLSSQALSTRREVGGNKPLDINELSDLEQGLLRQKG